MTPSTINDTKDTLFSRLYRTLIGTPVKRWYLHSLSSELIKLDATQRLAVTRQAVIGWLQTVLLIAVIVQSLFAGVLAALPPDVRASLSFLHRIEWGAYLGMVLIAAQIGYGWTQKLTVTNRYYLLAYRLSKPRLLQGESARRAQIAYFVVILLLAGAILWVNAHGFIVNPH